MNKSLFRTKKAQVLIVFVLISLFLSACAGSTLKNEAQNVALAGELAPTVRYTLTTSMADGKMAFIGVGGEVDGVVNPDLPAEVGDVVEITLTNGDGVEHDVAIDEFNIASDSVIQKGSSTQVVFAIEREGKYVYYCTLPGHRQAGMEGLVVVGSGGAQNGAAQAPSIVRSPVDLPAPLGDRPPQDIQIDIQAIELEGQLADGTTYTYWTFDGQVPGPFLRVRQGDQVTINLLNQSDSTMAHSIDLHAVTGPGGGAAVTQAAPGEEKSFTFQALNPGLYVYHCATPMVAHHIANGMYGLILVEPEGGLPDVDREFYVMQGELYTAGEFGEQGYQEFSEEDLLDETPEYFVFNGAVGALTEEQPLEAKTGETVRIFFGVGGPNFVSSFHVIGEIFDQVYDQASITSDPLTDIQTTLVPPGGAAVVEFDMEVPGRYILVDHALSRAERGLAGYLNVEGPENPDVFYSNEDGSDTGGH